MTETLKDPIFTCKDCGSHTLVEIMSDCYVTSEVVDVDSDGNIEYGNDLTNYGMVDRYQCDRCGLVIQEDGGNIVNPETLYKYLRKEQEDE